MSLELNPCPFCGSDDVYLENDSEENGEMWFVGCKCCYIGFSVGGEDGCCDATKEETVNAWNRRTP